MNNLEKVLVQKVINGNTRAYKKLFDLNADKLFRYLTQFSGDLDQVDDWVQRAFIIAFDKIHTFQFKSKFSTWLFTIAINEMRTDFRKLKKRTFTELDDSEALNIYEENLEIDWKYEMKVLLNRLDELKKSIFILYEVEGYSHSEISEILDISEASSRTNLFRAKKILKEQYLKLQGVA